MIPTSLEIDRDFGIEAYLSRVGLTSEPPADEGGLHLLHRAQFFSIPFENLDIQLGRSINLEPRSVFRKLVERNRGGYCFELNGLMLIALRMFGFAARALLARVHLSTPPSGRTHQVTCVEIGGRNWIMDVGFGAGGPRQPMLLEEGWVQEGDGWGLRLLRREPWGWLLQTREDDRWLDSYSFDLGHVTEADIAVGNHYTSTSPDTHFTQIRIAGRPNPRGRVSLRNFVLTEIVNGQKSTLEVEPGQPYLDVLWDRFGIRLDASYDELKPLSE